MTAHDRVNLPDAFWFQEGPGLRKWQFTTSGIKVLNVGNIMPDGSIDLSRTDRHVSVEEFEQRYTHFGVDSGDLVMASSGISFDNDGFLRTKIAFVEEDHLPLCMNTSTIRFKAVDGVSCLEYLRHWLQSVEFRRQVSRLVTGTAQLNFGPGHLKQMTIGLPPLEEQRRIAGILDAADALRRRRREAIALLDTFPGAIFAEMFGDPVEKSQQRKFVPLGAITSKIGSGATPRGGAKVYRDEGTKFIRSMNVRDGSFSEEGMVCIDEKAARQLSNVEVTEDDVFLNITGASVARCCRSDANLSGARVNQHVAIIRPQNSVFTDFIMGALCHPHMNANLLRIAEAGATRQAITKSEIEKLEVPAPTENEAEEYSRRLRVAKGMRDQVSDHQSQLETLFASLQSRAFAGEL